MFGVYYLYTCVYVYVCMCRLGGWYDGSSSALFHFIISFLVPSSWIMDHDDIHLILSLNTRSDNNPYVTLHCQQVVPAINRRTIGCLGVSGVLYMVCLGC